MENSYKSVTNQSQISHKSVTAGRDVTAHAVISVADTPLVASAYVRGRAIAMRSPVTGLTAVTATWVALTPDTTSANVRTLNSVRSSIHHVTPRRTGAHSEEE
ncbi:hypothetical protein FOA52_011532 [Chlamydomonas sp. UWO 241]|nr:hypothetical protein FOA52_011532 [Chlamydomonas sp. UWO 241]